MGFAGTLNAIVANLPRQRQTLLFSATQTKSVKDLARLSLDHPEYVAIHETQPSDLTSENVLDMPTGLEQHYMIVPLNEKVDRLFSFIKIHPFAKVLVFMASCKQACCSFIARV